MASFYSSGLKQTDNHEYRCEALEERLEALRAERRPVGGAPQDLLARHAAEMDSLAMQLASLKASHNHTAPLLAMKLTEQIITHVLSLGHDTAISARVIKKNFSVYNLRIACAGAV